MKITRVHLTNFKRFTELEIKNISSETKLVVLAGPNGCGKSSVFDAFEQIFNWHKNPTKENDYHRKDETKDWDCEIESDKGTYKKGNINTKNAVYIRSPYRVNPQFNVTTLNAMPDVIEDHDRPHRTIDLDQRMMNNYQRLWANLALEFHGSDNKTGKQIRDEFENKINNILYEMLEIRVSYIGNPLDGQGQLYFRKGNIDKFSFKNLSSGEKEVIDLVLDLILKRTKFNDTIFCIDEPDLHTNTAIQSKLLDEILKLIPDKSQLWIATHSLGFIKKAIDIYKQSNGKTAVILDFYSKDFDKPTVITPLIPSTNNIRKLFEVALDDLTSMVIPSKIYFCEGKSKYDTSSQSISKTDFDAQVYNEIFSDQDAIFYSSGGKSLVDFAKGLLLKIVKEAGGLRNIYGVRDRDSLTDKQRTEKLGENNNLKILSRKELENYLFDKEIIEAYCRKNGLNVQLMTSYSNITDIISQDITPYQSSIKQQCQFAGTVEDFKKELSKFITPDTNTYRELKQDLGL